MENRVKISVIVPVYCVKKYLSRCIESIIRQSYDNLEIILVDDGSPDECGEICDKYAQQDSRIRVIHKKNGGLSDARNSGIDISNGEWIAFVDSDDCVAQDFIEVLYNNAVATGCLVSQCNYERFGETIPNNNVKRECEYVIIDSHDLLHEIDCAKNTAAWNKLYRADLFEDIRFPKGKIHEDVATTFKLFVRAKKVCITQEKMYYYYVNTDSITTSKIKSNKLDLIDAYWEQVEFLRNRIDYAKHSVEATNRLVATFGTLASYADERYEDYNGFYLQLGQRYREMHSVLVGLPMRADLKLLVKLSSKSLLAFKICQKLKKVLRKRG